MNRPYIAPAIRPATHADEHALAVIDRATWSTTVSPAALWPVGTPFFAEHTQPENVLVAHDDTHIVGYLKLRPYPHPACSDHIQEIHGFAVSPSQQGRGIGSFLIRAAQKEAIRRQARRVRLRVLGTNLRAQRLYLAHRFQVEGRLREQFLIAGQYVDDVLMGTLLG
ncbi:N-acetyltransferase [Nocardia sp. NPDC048505]|uniref:GNAT family N-acetyltransferase n=1 Tax=Nocardia sp. NPDC048505 TaxID=3155756 RepID=UPI00340CBA9F